MSLIQFLKFRKVQMRLYKTHFETSHFQIGVFETKVTVAPGWSVLWSFQVIKHKTCNSFFNVKGNLRNLNFQKKGEIACKTISQIQNYERKNAVTFMSSKIKSTQLKGNCNHRLENSRLQTGCLQTGRFEMPRFPCSELQRVD